MIDEKTREKILKPDFAPVQLFPNLDKSRILAVCSELIDVWPEQAFHVWCHHHNLKANDIADLVDAKNKAYGNAVFEPCPFFTNLPPEATIRILLRNKATRILKGGEYPGDDDIKDFAGYLYLFAALQYA